MFPGDGRYAVYVTPVFTTTCNSRPTRASAHTLCHHPKQSSLLLGILERFVCGFGACEPASRHARTGGGSARHHRRTPAKKT